MSDAAIAFEKSINDAQELLERFDEENSQSSARNAESLKRAGMVMAMCAWETYVKDRIKEEFAVYLKPVEGSIVGRFVQKKLEEDLKRYYNPNTERTKRLFNDYFEVDITEGWSWNNYDVPQAKKTLNAIVGKRGNAAHQANTSSSAPHVVKRDELDKAIRFLKGLVEATDKVKVIK